MAINQADDNGSFVGNPVSNKLSSINIHSVAYDSSRLHNSDFSIDRLITVEARVIDWLSNIATQFLLRTYSIKLIRSFNCNLLLSSALSSFKSCPIHAFSLHDHTVDAALIYIERHTIERQLQQFYSSVKVVVAA